MLPTFLFILNLRDYFKHSSEHGRLNYCSSGLCDYVTVLCDADMTLEIGDLDKIATKLKMPATLHILEKTADDLA